MDIVQNSPRISASDYFDVNVQLILKVSIELVMSSVIYFYIVYSFAVFFNS